MEMSSFEGAYGFLTIATPVMETEASRYGSSYPGVEKRRLGITLKLLPKYSSEMFQRIKAHNKANSGGTPKTGRSKGLTTAKMS